MNRGKLLLLLLFTFSHFDVISQIQIGIQSGIALSHVNSKSKTENYSFFQNVGSIKTGFNPGYSTSFLLRKGFNKLLFFDTKIGFYESGYRIQLNDVYENGFPLGTFDPVIYDQRITVNYVNFHVSPSVSVFINKGKDIYLSIGSTYSLIVRGNEKIKFENIEGNKTVLDQIPSKTKSSLVPINRNDIALNTGFGGIVKIKKASLDINANYSLGLLKRNKYNGPDTPPPSQYFRTFSFTIAYLFDINKKENN